MVGHVGLRSYFALFLLLGLAARWTIAAPSTLWRRDLSEQSTCHDLKTYQTSHDGWLTSDMWAMTDASGYLSDWWNSHSGDTNFAANFANPWDLGQSFSCRFATPCARPDCDQMKRADDAESAPAYQVIVALSNINNYLVTFKQSLEASRTRWASLQTAVQQKYWPKAPSSNMAIKEVLNALNTIVACVAGAAGGPAAGVAAGLAGGIAGGVAISLADKDESLQHLAEMETAADGWYEGSMNFLNALNDDLMSKGHHNFWPDGISDLVPAVAGVAGLIGDRVIDIQPLLQNGLWSDYRNIPVLNTDDAKPMVSVTKLNNFFYHMILSQIINYSWQKQAVYIVKYDMTEEEFNNYVSPSGSNDHRLKLYYGGSAFFFQGLVWDGLLACSQNPPGWGDIEADLEGAANTNDILRSSADAWHDTGYGHQYSFADVGATDPKGILDAGPKGRGFWTIPVCQAPTDMVGNLDLLSQWLDPPGTCFFDNRENWSTWCLCADTTDANGKKFRDQFPSEWSERMSSHCSDGGSISDNKKM